jgi:predicted GTPase
VTHGGLPFAAGLVAARAAGALVAGPVVPALGYSPAQREALAATLNAADADVVIAGTPVDLAALLDLNKPVLRARYEFADAPAPGLAGELEAFLKAKALA